MAVVTAAKRRAVPEAHAATRESIERAIEYIWERYSEPVSLDELSRSALLSRFHFARTFREITGVTPGRFLSAVRIHQAKRLLVERNARALAHLDARCASHVLGRWNEGRTSLLGELPVPEPDIVAASR